MSIDDDVTNGFALPSVKSIFRTWRCCLDLDALVRGGLSVPWSPLPLLRSAADLGARFVRPGFSGVVVPPAARLDLSFQFARSRCVADLRIPSYY